MAQALVQPQAFLAFAACGMGLGLCYSLLIALRSATRKPALWALYDAAFVLIAVLGFLLCSVVPIGGQWRLFALIAYGLGWALFTVGVGKALGKRLHAIVTGAARRIRRLARYVNEKLEKREENE